MGEPSTQSPESDPGRRERRQILCLSAARFLEEGLGVIRLAIYQRLSSSTIVSSSPGRIHYPSTTVVLDPCHGHPCQKEIHPYSGLFQTQYTADSSPRGSGSYYSLINWLSVNKRFCSLKKFNCVVLADSPRVDDWEGYCA